MQSLLTETAEKREAPLPQEQSTVFCARAASLAFQAANCNVKNSQQGGSIEQYDMDEQPTVLLLTQNVGAMKPCSEAPPAENHSLANEESGEDGKGVNNVSSIAIVGETVDSDATPLPRFAKTEPTLNNEEEAMATSLQGVEGRAEVLTERTKALVYEFIADLRSWIHRAAAFADARRQRTRSLPLSSPQHGSSEIGDDVEMKTKKQRDADWWTNATNHPNIAEVHPPQIDVVVIHFQEIGGAERNKAFINFFSEAISTRLLPEAGWTSGLLMHHGDLDAARDLKTEEEKCSFNGVGSIVFLSPRMCPISSLLLIPHRIYIPVSDDPCSYGGSILRVFHGATFTSSPRSRKGFVFFSLRLGTQVVNLCNVHLFHDADNTKALASSPSRYARRRLEACLEAVTEGAALWAREEPFFLFGDLNTRLDGCELAQQLQRGPARIELRTGPKTLRCPDAFWAIFADPDGRAQLRGLDREPQQLLDAVAASTGVELGEMPVYFAPTYLRLPSTLADRAAPQTSTPALKEAPPGKWEHDGEKEQVEEEQGLATAAALIAPRARTNFEHRRIPAWCDRIMFNPAALAFITRQRGGGGGSRPLERNRGSEEGGGNSKGHVEEATDASNNRSGEVQSSRVEGGSHARNSSTRGGETSGSSDVLYLYDAVSLLHTDHDGVFLLF